MDRANSKHGPRLDDAMAKEVRGNLRGAGAGSRASGWRDREPRDEWEPEGNAGASPVVMSPEEQEGLSRLGKFLPRSAFPADRERLISAAATLRAPEDVLVTLGELDPSQRFATVAEVWAALGHGLDRRV